MRVDFGNDHAIEAYRDPASDDPDLVRYRALKGQHVTSVIFPEGIGIQEAFSNATAALSHHMEAGEAPRWIETDSPGLRSLLVEHYGGATRVGNSRPASWGHDLKGA